MRTLTIDDSPVARRVLKKNLEGTDYTVVAEASNGREALDLLERGLEVDAIFVDRYMPECDGLSFVRSLRNMPDHQDTFVMVASSDGDWSQITAALEAGADDYLIKPFDASSLKSKLALRDSTD